MVLVFGCKVNHADTSRSDCSCGQAHVTESLPVRGALVSTRYDTYTQLQDDICIEYFERPDESSGDWSKTWVRLSHCSNGVEVVSELRHGVDEDDFSAARDSGLYHQLHLLKHSPFAVRHRYDLQGVYSLARRRQGVFGAEDPAFYDISEEIMKNVNREDAARATSMDMTSEKGYFNTVNHITAQVFMTVLYSERVADLVADAHERKTMPELITGDFSAEQIANLETGPVDNYVDIINNEWGQELGKDLAEKYNITRATNWTPELLSDFLNDIQAYYSWAFQLGFDPFMPDDHVVQKFARKINIVKEGGMQ